MIETKGVQLDEVALDEEKDVKAIPEAVELLNVEKK
jgi:hypothetical protein